ncbi:MAG: lycopene cyclase domain-containing protein [Draconibacterium sp.]
MPLYSILLVSSVAVPLLLSFDRKLQFWRQWKYFFPAVFAVAAVYIFSDVLLTHDGVWGFNPRYHSDILFLGLPLEEWLFFIAIPYASIFLHDALVLYFPKFKLTEKTTRYLTYGILIFLVLMIVLHTGKTYTVYIFSTVAAALLWSLADKTNITSRFYATFLVILLPFVVVNAILTGTFIDGEVVWYNHAENLDIRFLTIPIEDFGYAFSMILLGLLLREKLQNLY